jgi:hypothetical protein
VRPRRDRQRWGPGGCRPRVVVSAERSRIAAWRPRRPMGAKTEAPTPQQRRTGAGVIFAAKRARTREASRSQLNDSFHLLARRAPTFSIAPWRCSRVTVDPICSRIAARKIASLASKPLAAITRPAISSVLSSSSAAVRSTPRQSRDSSSRSARSADCADRRASVGSTAGHDRWRERAVRRLCASGPPNAGRTAAAPLIDDTGAWRSARVFRRREAC